ncbi:MAG: hypothetical protein RIQ85_2133, partial [Pseudomonadota bacterium]
PDVLRSMLQEQNFKKKIYLRNLNQI